MMLVNLTSNISQKLRMCRPRKSLRNSQPSCIIDGWVVLSKVKEAPESQYLRGEAMMVVMLVRLMMAFMVMRLGCNGDDYLHALHRPYFWEGGCLGGAVKGEGVTFERFQYPSFPSELWWFQTSDRIRLWKNLVTSVPGLSVAGGVYLGLVFVFIFWSCF